MSVLNSCSFYTNMLLKKKKRRVFLVMRKMSYGTLLVQLVGPMHFEWWAS